MNSNVKTLFWLETKELFPHNFDTVYYNFVKIINQDIDVPQLQGLEERITYTLDKIATEKLNRDDIITLFPIVWNKFEPFVKTLLFRLKPDEYRTLSNNSESSLPDYLRALGIKVFVQENYRTKKTEAIYKTYHFRNNEAHECERYSNSQLYSWLSYTLQAYLIVTEKNMKELAEADRNQPGLFNEIQSYNKQVLTKIPILERYLRLFYRLEDINKFKKIHNVPGSTLIYDAFGKLISIGNFTIYEYGYENGIPIKCTEYSVDNDIKSIRGYWEFKYNQFGDINRHIFYLYKEQKNTFQPNREIEIEYKSDGGLSFTFYKYYIERQYYPTAANESKDHLEKKEEYSYVYDNRGLLVSVLNNKQRALVNYSYTSEGFLTRIDYLYENTWSEVNTIGDNLILTLKKNSNDEGRTIKKYLVQNGNIQSITTYNYDDDDVQTGKSVTTFEY